MSSLCSATSLRQTVFQYLRDHPGIWQKNKFEQNSELYKAFGAIGEVEQGTIRTYKIQFLDMLNESLERGIEVSPDDSVFDKAKKQLKKERDLKNGVFDKCALNPKHVKIWELPDEDLVDLFVKFVGFVGFIDVNGRAVLDPKGEIHRGEANPEPIDEITGEYHGIQQYQAEAILTYRDHDNILFIWFRGAGKTWKSSWINEFVQKYEAEKNLYFSLTDVAYIVANDIYIWAQKYDAVISAETVKGKKKITGRKDSYQKFGLINGSRFEIHGIRTSSTLGFHGWVITFDDVIDKDHERFPHLLKALIMRWNSQYSKIRRKKFVLDNTMKYPGDFISYLIDQFEKKAEAFKKRKGYIPDKYKLHIDLKTPYTDIQYSGGIKGYRKFIDKMNKDQIKYNPNKILCPWYTPDDIEISKLEDWEAFQAEMMGNPRALEGGMISPGDIWYVQLPHWTEGVQYGGTGVDCASTEDDDNDFTAIESCLMQKVYNEKLKQNQPQFTFYRSDVKRILARNVIVKNENEPYDWIDDNGKKVRRGIIETVQWHWRYHRDNYPGIPYIIAWERNNAGIAYMEQALRAYKLKEKVEIQNDIWEELSWPKFLVEDPNQAIKRKKKAKTNVRLGITQYKDKKSRIYAMKHPIETGQIRFTFNQEETVGMKQLEGYPNVKHDDSPDAKATIYDELKRRFKGGGKRGKPRGVREFEAKEQKAIEQYKLAGQPWLKDKQRALRKQKLRAYNRRVVRR